MILLAEDAEGRPVPRAVEVGKSECIPVAGIPDRRRDTTALQDRPEQAHPGGVGFAEEFNHGKWSRLDWHWQKEFATPGGAGKQVLQQIQGSQQIQSPCHLLASLNLMEAS